MNHFKTFLLLITLSLLLVWVGSLVGGAGGIVFAFMFVLAMNFVTYWYSDRIVLKMYKTKDASRHRSIVANQATAHLFIVKPISGDGLANFFSTHPPIEERVKRLRQ
jgi:Zn-dependent protease with chaperone function